MWEVNANQVIHYRTPGGDRFTELVDSLIRAQAHLCSIPSSEIRTNLRTNLRDGGVDTEVCQPAPSDPTGWIRDHPTIWQYKARKGKNIRPSELKKEINKKYARDRIQNGYAYRLCVCDELAAEKVEEWEKLLTAEARAIYSNAPEAKVLSASSLADWTSNLPEVVLRYFFPELATICLHLEAWKESITETTPEFVPVRAWEDIQIRLTRHVDFSLDPPQVVFPISGEAGVGKTRLAYEYLASLENARHLVVYTSDEENAKRIAIMLANKQSLKAILVADECGVAGRMKLQDLLNGASSLSENRLYRIVGRVINLLYA